MFRTRFTQLLGLKTPLASAAMLGPAGGALAAEVSLAGGFGFIAVRNLAQVKSEISIARSRFPKIPLDSRLPIGVGALGWIVEEMSIEEGERLVKEMARQCVAIWLSNGKDLGRWIKIAREEREDVKIFVQINQVEEARQAIEDWKVDVLVAQGIESGGHGSGYAPPLLSLIPALTSAFPTNLPPLLAAGGLSHGCHLASLLSLGADGIVLGTRFCLSDESLLSKSSKEALLKSKLGDTIRSFRFDEARGTTKGWPKGVDGRGLKNKLVDEKEWEMRGLDGVKERSAEATKLGETEWMVIWAGTGVGIMDKVIPAADIVKEVHEGALEKLKGIEKVVS